MTRVLVWHVHGSWMTSFVSVPHSHVVPLLPDRTLTCDWPDNVQEIEVGL